MQAVGCLLERKTPVVQHVQIVGGAHRAGDMIEVGVLIGVQPDHFAERQQQAECEDGHGGGLPAAAILLEPVHPPRERHARQHRHRRNHEDEVANAVVKRRTLHHRDQQRQRRRERQHQQDGLAPGRHLAARQRDQRADDAGDAKTQQHLRKLQREQGRQIRPGHVRHRDQRAIEHFLPRLLEEVREIGQRAKRIAWLHDRPRPDQAHDEIAEDQARQQHIGDVREPPGALARALRADFVDEQRHKTDHRVEQRQAAEDARAERQAGAEADDQDGPRRGRRDIPRRDGRDPASGSTIATANGASFGFMNMCP